MISNELGCQLHQKAALGGALTAQDKAQLHQWRQEQDDLETQSLSASHRETTPDTFQGQVDQALAALSAATRSLQEIATANDTLRAENSALRERLARRPEPEAP